MLTFTFTINPETQEAVTAGNISSMTALQYLQQIAISEGIKKANEKEDDNGLQ